MKRIGFFSGLVFLSVMLGMVACAPAEPSPACDLGYKEGLGTYLTDAKGMTLYYSLEDTPGTAEALPRSSYPGGSGEWRPFYTEELVLPFYLRREDFTVFTRSDGTNKQLAYTGWPLYYYSEDRRPGDTLGEGVGGVWHYVNT